MSNEDIKNEIIQKTPRTYLARDFAAFKRQLLDYAQTYFPDKIQDFSDASVGGMFLDMAAYIGDNLSFYMDYQFAESNPSTASELANIEMHARNAGVKISGASPAVAIVEFWIEVPAKQIDGEYGPDPDYLPIIKGQDTSVSANNGIAFVLTEDINYNDKDVAGDYIARQTQITNPAGIPTSYIMKREAICVSGAVATQTFSIADSYKAFRTIVLPNVNVSDILRVVDTEGNDYYEVETLSQDTVYRSVYNPNFDDVDSNLEVISAPYRFTASTNIRTRLTTLMFGAGDSTRLDSVVVPDPSELALPLYGKKTFSSFSVDPFSLMKTKTMGIAPQNTSISVTYRYGGGPQHNVGPNAITNIDSVVFKFSDKARFELSQGVQSSLTVDNVAAATGGAAAQSIAEIKNAIPAARGMQNRIVTKQDLLARIYTMPNEFGRVYRAGISPNPNNSLSAVLYVVSRNASGQLVPSPDVLKDNLATYINEYRLIGDALDILDARIINYRVVVSVIALPNSNKSEVASRIITAIQTVARTERYQIGMPLLESEFINAVINTRGVMSMVSLNFQNVNGTIANREYSRNAVNMSAYYNKGFYFAEQGDLFELRYPGNDIEVTVQ